MLTQTDTPSALFFHELNVLYDLEIQLCESMPRLVSLCTDEDLRFLILDHAQQNYDQIASLTAIFDQNEKTPTVNKCQTVTGMIGTGAHKMENAHCPYTRTLMMIAHCLRIEYYEMAAYEVTIILSTRLGLKRELPVLRQLLSEEKDMAAALLQLEPGLLKVAASDS